MAQLLHIRVEEKLKSQIDSIVAEGFYGSVTEFTKDSLRKNIRDYQKKEVLRLLGSQKASKNQITSKERLQVLKELGLE